MRGSEHDKHPGRPDQYAPVEHASPPVTSIQQRRGRRSGGDECGGQRRSWFSSTTSPSELDDAPTDAEPARPHERSTRQMLYLYSD